QATGAATVMARVVTTTFAVRPLGARTDLTRNHFLTHAGGSKANWGGSIGPSRGPRIAAFLKMSVIPLNPLRHPVFCRTASPIHGSAFRKTKNELPSRCLCRHACQCRLHLSRLLFELGREPCQPG